MLEKNTTTDSDVLPCPLWRRLGAIFYDSLLLVCVVFIAWQPVPLLPDTIDPLVSRTIRLGYLMLVCFAFFGWFWTHGGQTLGMRAWRIKLVSGETGSDGPVSWRMSWQRFSFALLSWVLAGLGFLWSIFHPGKLAWHDILSNTRLVVIPRQKSGRK